jgi:hypothetical protein
MSSDRPYRPHWISGQVVLPNASTLRAKLKCYEYNKGGEFWEIKGIIAAFCTQAKLPPTHQFIKKNFALWKMGWEHIGVQPCDVFIPSETAYSASLKRKPPVGIVDLTAEVDPDLVRQEFTLRTDGVIMALLQWSLFSRKGVHEVRAKYLLQLFLELTCDGKELAKIAWEDMLAECVEECPLVNASGSCVHLTQWRQAGAIVASHVVHKHVVSKLLAITGTSRFCDASAALLIRSVAVVSQCVKETIADRETDDVRKQAPTGSHEKRKRNDEDYKHFVVTEARRKRMASTSSQVAAVLEGTRAESKCRKWNLRRNAKYVSALWAVTTKGPVDGIYSMAPDATRLGQPARDFLCGPIWIARHRIGSWCVPQVPKRTNSTCKLIVSPRRC